MTPAGMAGHRRAPLQHNNAGNWTASAAKDESKVTFPAILVLSTYAIRRTRQALADRVPPVHVTAPDGRRASSLAKPGKRENGPDGTAPGGSCC
jgi:hypothetical protein